MKTGETNNNLPEVYVTGVSARNRSGYGIFWGENDKRNGGGIAEDGPQKMLIATLTGMKRVLKSCAEDKIEHVVIYTIVLGMDELMNEKRKPGNTESHAIFDWIYDNPVKFTIQHTNPCLHPPLFDALRIAHFHCGTHSTSKNPINDSLYQKGVIEVSVWAMSARIADTANGVYGVFFEKGFLGWNDYPLNVGYSVPESCDQFICHYKAIQTIFENLLGEYIHEVIIRTKSYFIRDIVNWLNDPSKPVGYSTCFVRNRTILNSLREHFNHFDKVAVEHIMEHDEKISEAEKLAISKLEKKEEIQKDPEVPPNILPRKPRSPLLPTPPSSDLETENCGIPFVYVNGAVFGGNGKKGMLRAAGAVYWGNKDPNNTTCIVQGEQNIFRANLFAVLVTLRMAISKGITRLTVFCGLQNLNVYLTQNLEKWWKRNWISNKGQPIENADVYRDIAVCKIKFEMVEFRQPKEASLETIENIKEMAMNAAKNLVNNEEKLENF